MRTIVVLAVVLGATVGLLSSDGAEPGQPMGDPVTVPAPIYGQPVLPSPYHGPTYVPGPPVVAQRDDVAWLRHEYVALAKKRAERMDGPELQKEIAELRCQWLISELTALGSEYDDVRAGIAAMVLKAKDKEELKKLFQSVLDEMDEEKSTAEKLPDLTPPTTTPKRD